MEASVEAPDLTDNEGTLVGLVERQQSITAYQISKIYEASPVSNFNTSKGKLYPLISRLKQRGLLRGQLVEGDARGTERLMCTELGQAALVKWLKQIRPAHLLLEDPLRTKIQSFHLLTRDEQIEWLVDAKAALNDKLRELQDYGSQVTVPYHGFVHENAVMSLRARQEWVERVLHQTVKGQH